MYAFNTLVIMFTSVIFQCLPWRSLQFECVMVMNCHNYPNKGIIQVMWPIDYICYVSC